MLMDAPTAGFATPTEFDSRHVHRFIASPNFGDRRGRRIDMLLLHYTGLTSGDLALARLCDPATEVSCHYLVWEDGRIDQLVPEAARAWHAGRASWKGETDVNAMSVGIEIVNAGHDGGCPPFPAAQIDAVIDLGGDICARHGIVPARVLGHSDVAPGRKQDPGEHFPWPVLARAGLCLAVTPPPVLDPARPVVERQELARLRGRLEAIGYAPAESGDVLGAVVRAFQRRWRPERVDGVLDAATAALVDAVAGAAA